MSLAFASASSSFRQYRRRSAPKRFDTNRGIRESRSMNHGPAVYAGDVEVFSIIFGKEVERHHCFSTIVHTSCSPGMKLD